MRAPRSVELSAALKDLAKILLYLAATVLLGAALAPLLFWGGQALAEHGVLTFLKNADFHRFFDRGVLIAAVALLFPLAKSLRIHSVADLGLLPNARWGRDLTLGVAVALASSALLAAWAWSLGTWRLHELRSLSPLLQALLAAIAVSAIEEALFRGAMQGVIQRSAPRHVALLVVAALFALVHFVRPPDNTIAPAAVVWTSGFALIPQVFWQLKDPMLFFGGVSTLFLVGWILGYARLKTSSLWMPFGLHAGWVFGHKAGELGWVKAGKHVPAVAPWFGPKLLIGLAPVLLLTATALALTWRLQRRRARVGS